jgi:hypothetical protein
VAAVETAEAGLRIPARNRRCSSISSARTS